MKGIVLDEIGSAIELVLLLAFIGGLCWLLNINFADILSMIGSIGGDIIDYAVGLL